MPEAAEPTPTPEHDHAWRKQRDVQQDWSETYTCDLCDLSWAS